MKLKFKQTFPYSMDVVLRALDRREEKENSVPSILDFQILENEWHNMVRKRRMRFGARLDIPTLLKKAFPKTDVSWDYEETWDLESLRREWRILPNDYKSYFSCHGYTEYEEVESHGVKKVVRTLHGDMKISVPLLGHIVEEALTQRLRRDARREHKLLCEIIENEILTPQENGLCVQ